MSHFHWPATLSQVTRLATDSVQFAQASPYSRSVKLAHATIADFSAAARVGPLPLLECSWSAMHVLRPTRTHECIEARPVSVELVTALALRCFCCAAAGSRAKDASSMLERTTTMRFMVPTRSGALQKSRRSQVRFSRGRHLCARARTSKVGRCIVCVTGAEWHDQVRCRGGRP